MYIKISIECNVCHPVSTVFIITHKRICVSSILFHQQMRAGIHTSVDQKVIRFDHFHHHRDHRRRVSRQKKKILLVNKYGYALERSHVNF
jgi:hypothetical protein